MKIDHYLFSAEIIKRNIQYLVHFTPTINLVGMCETGYILPRHELIKLDLFNDEMRDYTEFTDEIRLDGDKYINTSIQHPNDFLLRKFKERSNDKPWVRWCVIKINPKYIYDDETLFSVTNAANKYNRENIGITGDFAKFKSMFAETVKVVSANYSMEKHRDGLTDNLTTDSQAEVLIKNKIPLTDIIEIAFENNEDLVLTKNAIGNIPCHLTVEPLVFQNRNAILKQSFNTESINEESFIPEGEKYCYYSIDGNRFISYGDTYRSEYSVKDGTQVICDECFNDQYSEIDSFYLSELHLPSSIKAIGKNAFCSSIEKITCDSPFFKIECDALLSADGKVFYKYFGNDKVYFIPKGVETIIGGAFTDMQINKITIPKSVKEIGDNPFAGIYERDKDFNFSYDLNIECLSPYFEIRDNCLIHKVTKHLISYLRNEKDIIINNISSIGKNAFYSKNCEKITFDNSDITYVDEYAFGWCFNLKKVMVPVNEYTKSCKTGGATPYLKFID